jgi:hypothetical protein
LLFRWVVSFPPISAWSVSSKEPSWRWPSCRECRQISEEKSKKNFFLNSKIIIKKTF